LFKQKLCIAENSLQRQPTTFWCSEDQNFKYFIESDLSTTEDIPCGSVTGRFHSMTLSKESNHCFLVKLPPQLSSYALV